MKLFSLEYQYTNPNFNIVPLINMNIHHLLYEVNKDIMEGIDIKNTSDPTEFEILYKFKDIGGDLGGFKTYMYVNTKVNRRFAGNGNTEIVFTSKSIPYECHAQMVNEKYKLLEYPLYIQKYIFQEAITGTGTATNIQVIHMFKLKPDNESDITVAMENAIGILIKKMYSRLKVAIENLKA